MTEHSPDQEPRLLEGSSADQMTVSVEVIGGIVASGNVAYATEKIEQLCRHAPGAVDCRAHLFVLADDHGRSMAIADAVLVLAGDVVICAGAEATTAHEAIDDLAARLDRRIKTLGAGEERLAQEPQAPSSATTRVSSTRERMPSLR
jgi:ribosome-associated translation inhibitor RaiA